MSKKTSTSSAAPGGVSPHRHTSNEPTSALEVVAPGKLNLKPIIRDAEMGQQLTEQYRKAVGGMTEVLRFGAMMMGLRQHILNSTRGVKLPRGSNSDGGVKAWLEQFAPEVKEATAYRFLHVAEAVAADFQLPAKVSFIELATRAPEQLSGALREKQDELWDFVNGTSQRSWLDRFAPAKEFDPSTRAPRRLLTPEEQLIQKDKFAQEKYQLLWAGIADAQNVDKDNLLRLPVTTANPQHEVSLVMLRDITAAFVDLLNSAIKAR